MNKKKYGKGDERDFFFRKKNSIIINNVMDFEGKVLNPIQTFEQAFQHYPEILDEIEKQGFKVPSPIQSQAWPILLSGKDLIGIAQTGTGNQMNYSIIIRITKKNCFS